MDWIGNTWEVGIGAWDLRVGIGYIHWVWTCWIYSEDAAPLVDSRAIPDSNRQSGTNPLPHTTSSMDDNPDVETLVTGLVADSESTRKYAVFKLQAMLNDPSFADAFIEGDGLPALRRCVLESTGNTQAYALGSLDALLELDLGWELSLIHI